VEGCGTGSVEKTEDIAVARRFKKRGRRWYGRRVNPVLKLRFLSSMGNGGPIGINGTTSMQDIAA